MTKSLKATIPSLTPFQKLIAGAALSLAAAFSASAHAPAPGTPDHNLLAPHKDFIMHMKRADGSMGSCCSDNDAFGDLEERRTTDGKYEVKLTHDLQRNKLPAPVWVTIPEKAILSAKHAKAVCQEYKQGNNASNTCTSPNFNVIWHNGDLKNGGKDITIWCYFPRPQVMN